VLDIQDWNKLNVRRLCDAIFYSCAISKEMPADKQKPKMSSSEKAAAKKLKHKENVAKANPDLSAAKKDKNDAKRARRAESRSSKVFS
jgi:hypothetical protein